MTAVKTSPPPPPPPSPSPDGLSQRERFLRTLRYEPVDRRPIHLAGPWGETVERWHREGLPAGVNDVHNYLGVSEFGYRTANISPIAGPHPTFPRTVLRQEGDEILYTDSYGRTVRDFTSHTSMPEWLEFPVRDAASLRRYLDEHFDVADLDSRFAPDWADKARAAAARGDIILIDGGCYYWTLRSIAGVDGASYLLYDCPELVDELCERYFTVVMEGLRRASRPSSWTSSASARISPSRPGRCCRRRCSAVSSSRATPRPWPSPAGTASS